MLPEAFRPRFLGQVRLRMGRDSLEQGIELPGRDRRQDLISKLGHDSILADIQGSEDAMAKVDDFMTKHPEIVQNPDWVSYGTFRDLRARSQEGMRNIAPIKERLSSPDPNDWTWLSHSEQVLLDDWRKDVGAMVKLISVDPVFRAPGGTLPPGPGAASPGAPSATAPAAPSAFPTTTVLAVGGVAVAGLAALLVFR